MRLLESIVAPTQRGPASAADTTARASEFAAARPVIVLTCIDPRLNPLIPRVLGSPEDWFIWLRDGGNVITGQRRSTRREKALVTPRAARSLAALKTASGIETLRVATTTAVSVAAAVAFLLCTFLSVSPSHEASHQHDGDRSGELACVLCALAKSQVTGAEPAPVVTPLAVVAALTIPSLVVCLELPASDRSLPPGRAPPVV